MPEQLFPPPNCTVCSNSSLAKDYCSTATDQCATSCYVIFFEPRCKRECVQHCHTEVCSGAATLPRSAAATTKANHSSLANYSLAEIAPSLLSGELIFSAPGKSCVE
mmetsp:Transcript_16070/g.48285  ORF Transcript_16070/g.48285 Transcript_16070/m.48285 type:complete len:107 (+) Transcript_16070:223-543(+)